MFKDELKKLRLDNNYTQDDLAKELNVSKSTISMYESGSRMPGLEMLEAIADFFNVDMNRLTSNQPQSKAPFAAFGKTNDDFTNDEIKQINNFIDFVRKQRGD